MSALYAAAGMLVVAQVVGIYGLKTRKADLLLSVVMVVLLVGAVALAYEGVQGIRHL